MSEKCFDIGTIQAFLDGELAAGKSKAVSRHVSACDDCAILLAEAEEESAFAFSALEQEFNTLVPTNRLWTKINDSIEKEKKPFWQIVFAYFSNPSVAAFAGLLIVVGLFAAFFSLKSVDKGYVAENNSDKQITVSTISKVDSPVPSIGEIEPKINGAENTKTTESSNKTVKYDVVKAGFSKRETNQRRIYNQPTNSTINRTPSLIVVKPRIADDNNILGEESYVKTIAALTKTINVSKDDVLKPSARFAFERDLAVTDDAIKKMKVEVARNPKNEAAKDVLRASYQNKIDLLNSVAEKSELMASLK